MKEHFENVIEFLKQQDINGCITGSILLDYFENEQHLQDVDLFVYDEKSFNKILFSMHHNKMFTILDPIEQWKFDKHINSNEQTFYKYGLVTIKFYYNTFIPVNIILKKKCTDIFSVLTSFDMDIISKGYDIKTKQYLDLSGDSHITKIASWNKWNMAYYSHDVWEISRILRQFLRVDKYQKRGYDMSEVVLKYKEITNNLLKFVNIFNSESFEEKLKTTKENVLILQKIMDKWLLVGSFTEKEIELTNKIIKLL